MPWTLRCPDDASVIVGMNTSPVNAQNDDFLRDLHVALDAVERDHAGRAVIFASEGRCFCAGLDFDSIFGLFTGGDRDRLVQWARYYISSMVRVFALPQPTAAAMAGHAYAGGVVLAMACDFRVAAPEARISLNEVPIGIPMPAAYVEMIRYAIGSPAAARSMLLGETFSGQRALDGGLVHELAAPDAVVDAARRLIGGVSPSARHAYAFTKRALQAPAMARIRDAAEGQDREIPHLLSSAETRALLAERYRAIKGTLPSWAPDPA